MPTSHTPEPWATSRDAVPQGYTQITVYSEATGERVATVFGTPANATLITAAPKLLAACEAAENWLHEYEQGPDTGVALLLIQLRDAIHDATKPQ